MLDKELKDLLNKTSKQMKTAKQMLESQEKTFKVLNAKIQQDKGKFSDDDLAKLDDQLTRVKELKKELNGLKNNQ